MHRAGSPPTSASAAREPLPTYFIMNEVRFMEVMTMFGEFISSLGFPIACVIAMFYMWNKEREEHKAESAKWCEAINNNSIIMERICAKLDLESDKDV